MDYENHIKKFETDVQKLIVLGTVDKEKNSYNPNK